MKRAGNPDPRGSRFPAPFLRRFCDFVRDAKDEFPLVRHLDRFTGDERSVAADQQAAVEPFVERRAGRAIGRKRRNRNNRAAGQRMTGQTEGRAAG